MGMKNALLLGICALLLVISSGCVLPFPTGNTNAGKGLIITDWKSQFPEIYAGEYTVFQAKVKNTGSFEATNIHFQFTGLDEWEYNKITVSGWEEPKAVQKLCQYGEEGLKLSPPSEEFGTEGEEIFCTWDAKPPKMRESLMMTYTPDLTVYYDYMARSVLSATVLSRMELKRLQETGGEFPFENKISGDSPVLIDASVESPIIVTEAGKVTFPIRITVRNAGGGLICYRMKGKAGGCGDSANLNKVSLEITSGSAKLTGDCTNPIELSLWKGSEGSVTCRMQADAPEYALKQIMIDVTAYYRYYTDAETPVKVSARP